MASTDVTPMEASRIVSHMNNEHAESLEHYLEYFGRFRPADVVHPRITSFTTPELVVEFGPVGQRRTWSYKFDPPMQAGQARVRLEEMHQVARKGLGLSNVTINDFSLSPSGWLKFALVTFVELAVALCPPVLLAAYTPWGVKQVARVYGPLGIEATRANLGLGLKSFLTLLWAVPHVLEIRGSLRPLMRRYNMKERTARWTWTIAVFVGGVSVWPELKKTGLAQERALAEKDKTT